MGDDAVGLMCCDTEAAPEWTEAMARTGLTVKTVRGDAARNGVGVLVIRAHDTQQAMAALAAPAREGDSGIPILVLLDDGASDDRAAILEAGADDCACEPLGPREIGIRIGRLMSQADLARRTAKQQTVLAREMNHARRVQQHILPLEPPSIEGVHVAARYLPAADIGGDLFDVIPHDAENVAFFMADVAGHGMGAALNTMVIKSQLVIWSRPGITVAETLGMLNNKLHSLTDLDYATAVYGLLSVPQRRFEYAVAGHPNPLLMRCGEAPRLLEVSRLPASNTGFRAGLPLGLFSDGVYVSEIIDLQPGDRVLMFTDGVIEWRDAADNLLGTEGLRELLQRSNDMPIGDQLAWLLGQLEALSPGEPPADDVNLLAFEV